MKAVHFSVLFSKHKKHVPTNLNGTWLHEILRYGFMIFISAWFFQGILYMCTREKILKTLLEIMFIVMVTYIMPLWLAFLIVHTLNFMLNGQFIAVLTHMGFFTHRADKFIAYSQKLQKRILRADSVEKAIVYGSLSEGNYKNTSDMDIRIIPENNRISKWKTCLWAVKERAMAFFAGFPLDMYVFSLDRSVQVMKTKYSPIVFKDKGCPIENYYYKLVDFDDFILRFKLKQNIA